MSMNEVRGVDLITQVFSPRIAVLSTSAAEQLALKNNLSFVQLLRPFAQMSRTDAALRDPYNNTVHEVRNLKLKFEEIENNDLMPDQNTVSQLLNAAVSDSLSKLNGSKVSSKYGSYNLNMHSSAPWFESFRNHFMRTLPVSQHEFTRHFVACLLVVSSSEPDPKTEFANLEKQFRENVSELGSQRWFMSEILCCRVLVHDVAEGDEKAASELIQELKNEMGRGPHLSYLLSINSRRVFEVQELMKSNKKYGPKMVDPWKRFMSDTVNVTAKQFQHQKTKRDNSRSNPGSNSAMTNGSVDSDKEIIRHPLDSTANSNLADDQSDSSPEVFEGNSDEISYHGLYMTSNDQEAIRSFVDDFIRRALLPHYEKQIRSLYDQLVAKKAITKSFFSATKKWLASGRTASYPLHFGSAENANFYPPEASEVQLRKLGDLAFLFQMYDIAYNIYYQCKGDFSSDGAHLFYAGSLEMTVFCQFMLGKSLTTSYIDTAISAYLYQCRNYNYALRCCLLCSEILLCKSVYSEATTNFLKLTSEESDLKSALLLEQVAFCYINSRGFPKPRKFAFYMILAGYRYNKADQKHHLLRTYDLAHQVFKSSSWSYAEDNINLTIAKHSHLVGKLDVSTQSYLSLLSTNSMDKSTQQVNFFQDFISCFKDFIDNSRALKDSKSTALPEVSLPHINSQAVAVTYGALQRDSNFDAPFIDSSHWIDLEKAATLFVTGAKTLQVTWKPSIQILSQTTTNSIRPRTARNEPVTVKLQFENTMKFHLYLEKIHLLWTLKRSGSEDSIENEYDILEGNKYVKTEVINELCFDNLEIKSVSLGMIPCVEGEINIVGVAYIMCSGSAETTFNRKTVRVKQELNVVGPKLNNTLNDRLTNARGPDFRLQFTVVSPQPLLEVQFSPLPTDMLCGEIQTTRVTFHNRGQIPISSVLVSSKDCGHFAFGSADPAMLGSVQGGPRFKPESVADVFELQLPGGVLLPGQGTTMSFWVRGMTNPGRYAISILFLYKHTSSDHNMPHRVVKKSFEIEARSSVAVSCIKNRSFDKSFQMIFSLNNLLQSMNSQNLSSLSLNALVCVSKRWMIRSPVSFSSCAETQTKYRNDIEASKISEQEQLNFEVTLDRVSGNDDDFGISILTPEHASDVKYHPFSEFLARNSAMFPEIKTILRSPKKSADVKHPLNSKSFVAKSTIISKVDATFIFVWNLSYVNADKKVLSSGQHYFSVDEIDYESSVSPIPEVSLSQNPNLPYIVRFDMKYDENHDLKLVKSFTNVHVQITFHNCSEKEAQVKLFLPESPSQSSVFTLEKLGVRESFSFWWVCKSTWLFSLPPLGQRQISLKACFFKPGTYNLNNVSVLASFNPNVYKFVEQDCRFATFITINSNQGK